MWMKSYSPRRIEFLKNTNCPNDTNFCFIRLIRVIRGLLEVLKNTNDPNDTNINAAGLLESSKEHELSEWHEFLFYSVDSSDSGSFS